LLRIKYNSNIKIKKRLVMINDLAPKEFQNYLSNNDTVLVDVREKWELDLCKIEGAIHCPMSTIAESFSDLNPDDNIAVYCHHGVRSMQVANFLISKDFQSLVNLQGGIDAWSREIDPLVDRY
jgi:rhodanese-related sulfurtransferase|tara:strand:+ start:1441 stop:1809 length:369 start_codon:yes stop_codon:yes gene_type:complete